MQIQQTPKQLQQLLQLPLQQPLPHIIFQQEGFFILFLGEPEKNGKPDYPKCCQNLKKLYWIILFWCHLHTARFGGEGGGIYFIFIWVDMCLEEKVQIWSGGCNLISPLPFHLCTSWLVYLNSALSSVWKLISFDVGRTRSIKMWQS